MPVPKIPKVSPVSLEELPSALSTSGEDLLDFTKLDMSAAPVSNGAMEKSKAIEEATVKKQQNKEPKKTQMRGFLDRQKESTVTSAPKEQEVASKATTSSDSPTKTEPRAQKEGTVSSAASVEAVVEIVDEPLTRPQHAFEFSSTWQHLTSTGRIHQLAQLLLLVDAKEYVFAFNLSSPFSLCSYARVVDVDWDGDKMSQLMQSLQMGVSLDKERVRVVLSSLRQLPNVQLSELFLTDDEKRILEGFCA